MIRSVSEQCAQRSYRANARTNRFVQCGGKKSLPFAYLERSDDFKHHANSPSTITFVFLLQLYQADKSSISKIWHHLCVIYLSEACREQKIKVSARVQIVE